MTLAQLLALAQVVGPALSSLLPLAKSLAEAIQTHPDATPEEKKTALDLLQSKLEETQREVDQA